MKVAQSSLVEEPFNPVPAGPSPLTAGHRLENLSAAARLQFHQAQAHRADRPRHRTGRTAAGHLALRAGQTAAFTSDAEARWAGEWLAWDGYGKFWAQVVRGLLRKSDQAAFQVRATETDDGSRLRLDIDALTPEGGFRDRLPIDVTALDTATGQTQPFTPSRSPRAATAQSSTCRAAETRARGGTTTMFSVSSPELLERPYVFGHTRSYPREFLRTDTDEEFSTRGRRRRAWPVSTRRRRDFRASGAFLGPPGGFNELFPCRRPALTANRHLPAASHLETAAVRRQVPASPATVAS